MKIQTIPAQITTVEDTIAGNLTITQLILLMLPLFWSMVVFTLFAPTMHVALYKLFLITPVSVLSLTLAVRVKGKLVLTWVILLLRFSTRPGYYVYDKNDSYLRNTYEDKEKKTKRLRNVRSQKHTAQTKNAPPLTVGDIVRLHGMLSQPDYSFSVRPAKKGGLSVSLEQTS